MMFEFALIINMVDRIRICKYVNFVIAKHIPKKKTNETK